MFRLALAIAVTAGLTACSETNSDLSTSVPLRRLNSTEKFKISTVSESLAAATQAAGTDLAGSTLIASLFDDGGSERIRKMTEAVNNNCTRRNTIPEKDGSGLPPEGKFYVAVGGPSCPIDLYRADDNHTVEKEESIRVRVVTRTDYSVLHASYAELNDVTAFDLTTRLSVVGSGQSGVVNAGAAITGHLLSQRYGRVGLNIGMNYSFNRDAGTQSANTSITISFPNFVAVGRIASKQDRYSGSVVFYLNNRAVSQEEFEQVFGSAPGNGGGLSSYLENSVFLNNARRF